MNSLSRILINATFALIGCLLRADEASLLYSLIAPVGSVEPGAAIEVQVAVLNRSANPAVVELPPSLGGELVAGGAPAAVLLQSRDVARSATIAPGTFRLHTYTMVLPRTASAGDATLDLPLAGFGGHARTVLTIGARGEVATRGTTATQRPLTTLARAQPVAAAMRRMFADRIAPHESIYFIYGPDAPAAKFQFSFKYRLLDFTVDDPNTRIRTLQFAFTQQSLWDINGVSSPFYDTSYMPELLYESLASAGAAANRWFTWLGFQAAYKHESNGRDGPLSRSLDMIYARSVFAFGPLERWHVLVIPEVFTYIGALDETPGIKAFRDYGKLRLVLGRNDGPTLMMAAWAGRDFDHATAQVDLTFPIKTRLLNFETYLLVQGFSGYGESLLSYNEKSKTVRAGFSFVR